MIRSLSVAKTTRAHVPSKLAPVHISKATFFGFGKKERADKSDNNPNLSRLPADMAKPIFNTKGEAKKSDMADVLERREAVRATQLRDRETGTTALQNHKIRSTKEIVTLSSDSPLKAALRANSDVVKAKHGGTPIEQVDDDERIREEVEIASKNKASMDAAAQRLIDDKITNTFGFANSSLAKATGISSYVNARKEHAAHVAMNNPSNNMLPEMIAEFSSSHALHNMRQARLTTAKYAKYFMPTWDPVIQRTPRTTLVKDLGVENLGMGNSEELSLAQASAPESKSFFSRLGSAWKATKKSAREPTLADLDLVGDALSGTSVNLRENMCQPHNLTIAISYNSEAAFDISRHAFLNMMERYHNRSFLVPGYSMEITVNPKLLIPTNQFLKKFMSKEKIVSQMAARYPESSAYLDSIIMFFLENEDEPFYRWKLSSNALNRFTSYIFLLDSNGKIRWSGAMSQIPTEEEYTRFHDMVEMLISQDALATGAPDHPTESSRKRGPKK